MGNRTDDSSAALDDAQHRAHATEIARCRNRIKAAVERSRQELLSEVQVDDEALPAEQAKRGILGWLIEYRTQTPGLRGKLQDAEVTGMPFSKRS